MEILTLVRASSFILIYGLFCASATAEGLPSGKVLMDEQFRHYRGIESEIEVIDMTLTSESGAEQNRQIWRRIQYATTESQQGDMSMFTFDEPKNLQDVGLLTLENDGGQDRQWIYLPAYRRSRRIPASQEGDSFFGTEFSYEDVRLQSSSVDRYDYKTIRKEVESGVPCYVVKATAKEGVSSAYAHRLLWLAGYPARILKVEYYDTKERLWKIQHNTGWHDEINGTWRFKEMNMKNKLNGRGTILHIQDRYAPIDFPEDYFQVHRLEQGVNDLLIKDLAR